MTWVTPKTFSSGEILTAADLNTYLTGNMEALKAPPTGHYEADEGSNYTTTSTTFVDVDATNLSLTIDTTGGDVLVGFYGTFRNSINGRVYLNLVDNGSAIAGDDGMMGTVVTNVDAQNTMSFVHLITGVSAGAHIIKLQWKVQGGTGTLYAGAGTSTADVHPQFWVREVS